MQTESADAQKPNLPLTTFNDYQITVIEFEDHPWFIAKQIGAKLGYEDDGANLPKLIAGKWSEEFIEGADYQKLTNGRLAAFKAAIRNQVSNGNLVDARASHLLLLSESGAQLAAMKREGPEGVAFRKLLRFTILPEWQKSRHQAAPAVPAASALTAKPEDEQRRQEELRQIQSLLKGWPLDALRVVEGHLQVWATGTDFNAALRRLLRQVAAMTPEEVNEITRFLEVSRAKLPAGFGELSPGTRMGLVLGMARHWLSYPDYRLLQVAAAAEKEWTQTAPPPEWIPGGRKPEGMR